MTKKKIKISNIIAFIIGIVCIVGIIYSLTHIINWKKDVDSNKKVKEETNEKVKLVKEKYTVDFDALKKQNPDTIAYIKVNNTKIDYVVVKGTDNSYYLTHNFNKEYNIAGWIFGDYRNRFNGTDKNLIIYGHNTKDGSMFGTLIDVLDSKWQSNKDNLEVTLVTEQGQYKYQVFSTYPIVPEDYYLTTAFSSDEEYLNFLNELKSRSNNNYNVELTANDKILTLSSCIGEGEKRVVLHAKLIGVE